MCQCNHNCNTCNDCKNLSPRDVFNGVCILKNSQVMIDSAACDNFESVAKCKYCKHYHPSDSTHNLGICTLENVMAFPDLTGCEDFVKVE